MLGNLFNTLRSIANHPLNRGHVAAALARFLAWQVGTRLLPGPVLVPFAGGSRLLLGRGMHGATANLYTGLQEYEEMAFVLHCLRKGDSFVDAGANVGAYTVLAAAVRGARCYSFEPVPASFESLAANIACNGIGQRCQAFRVALGSEDGEVWFTTDAGPMNHVLAKREPVGNCVTVPQCRLDDVLRGAPVTALKVDVEGYEAEVLRGAAATLSSSELLAVIAEVNGESRRYGVSREEVFRILREAGLVPVRYCPEERKLLPGCNNRGNAIFVRDPVRVEQRLKQARAVRVQGRYV